MKINFKIIKKGNRGYTILETMIAVALFLIVVTAGTSALLNAHSLYKKSQDMRSLVDNLSFITEDISRNLRTGSNYHCISNVSDLSNLTTATSCSIGDGIAFEETHGDSLEPNDQWVYKIDTVNGTTYDISKSINSGSTWTQLNSSEISFSSGSGFSVLGAEDLTSGNEQQPLVIIKLVGTITYKNTITPFSVQTSVSQRLVDN